MMLSHRPRNRTTSSHGLCIALAVLVTLLPGMAWAISTRTLWYQTGDPAYPGYGASVGSAGDVNGDGYEDFIVGASGNISSAGRAYVYFGGPGIDDVADLILTGEAASDGFGRSVGTAGDVNGDGYSDVIVGARDAASGRGRAYVFFGGPGADAVADLTITGNVTGDWLGFSVGTVGDVNEDGYSDIIVGMPGYNGQQGRALIYFGGATPDAAPDVTMTGGAAGDFFGGSVGRAGDVNGDGHEDVIVGAELSGSWRGSAYIFYGGPYLDDWADLTLVGESDPDWFGRSVSAAGDVNGDGFGDVVVGAVQHGGFQIGRAYVFFGGPAPDAVADVLMTGAGALDQLGQMVGAAGDVNADGYADWMVGAYGSDLMGHVFVSFGGPSPSGNRDMDLSGEVVNSGFGAAAGAGDFDGDGFVDLVVGARGGEPGHAYVKGIYPYQVLAPNGGEQWVAGQRSVVRWRGHDPADLALSYDGGSSWAAIASGIGGLEENEYEIVTPAIATEHAMVRLSYTGQTVKRGTSDASDGVFRILMPPRTPSAADRLEMTPTGVSANEYLGSSVGTAGDMNGDGYADVIVGAYGFNNFQGRAYVYYGGPDTDLVPDLTLTGEGPFQYFGISVGTAGDVNGDGYADVIVGAQEYAGSTGRAYVYYGGPTADAVPDLTLTGLSSGNSFGCSVGSAGDVNGDGYADLIVGAFGYNGGTGRAYLYYGGLSPDAVPDLTLTGAASNNYFGSSVGPAGDVNGDGYADFVVGAYNFQGGQGRAYVYCGGPGLDAVADLVLTGEVAGDYFGTAVGTAGDVNGDGFADVVVGANGFSGSRGRAYVYFGGAVLDPRADLTLNGGSSGSNFGGSVGPAGDVNGDGFSDLVVGARGSGPTGCAYVFYGGPVADAVEDHVLVGESPNTLFGSSVGAAGDMDGDGYSDLIVGAMWYGGFQGRAYVYGFNRFFLTSPNGGEIWNVGAARSIAWRGAEKADVWLSTNAGRSYDLLAASRGGAENNSWPLRVPHAPGKFTMVKLTPSDAAIGGFDASDSLFTIQASVSLLALLAAPAPDRAGTAVITWSTDPGPDDLAGYRLERASGSGSWQTLVPLTKATSYTDDATGGGGVRYRLLAVNGFGEELALGETSLRALSSLAAWPLPYRSGALNVSFATYGGLGGGTGPSEVSVFDVSGRWVRTVARGAYGAGYQTAAWDGRDASGRNVPAGVYFIRAESAGQVKTLKIAVLR